MIHAFLGEEKKVKKGVNSLVLEYKKKSPDLLFFAFDNDVFDVEKVKELAASAVLFDGIIVTVIKGIASDTENRDKLIDLLGELALSQNIFIIADKELPKTILSKINKHAEDIQVYQSTAFPQKEDGKIFLLADALGGRDKKKLWVLLQKARLEGVPSEQIHGLLFWQIKSMLSALGSKNAEDAGLKPFVFTKSRNFLKNYSKSELNKISSQLLKIYHDARRGGAELDLAIEEFVLKI